MRFTLSLLLTFVVATSAFGGAVAGKTRALVDGPWMAFWVPLAGGFFEEILFENTLPSFGTLSYTSVATDGERFLVAYCGRGIGIYGEGDPLAQKTTVLQGQNAGCFAQWDAAHDRYLLAYHDQGTARIAAISPDGAILQTAALPDIERVAGLAVNGDRVLVLEAPGWPQTLPFIGSEEVRTHALLLDPHFTALKDITLGRFTEMAPYQEVFSAIPFGTGFYVAWYQGVIDYGGERNADSTVFGTRVTADGNALDVHARPGSYGTELVGRILQRSAPNVIGADLIDRGTHVIAVMKQADFIEQLVPLDGVFVASDGLTLGSRNFAQVHLAENAPYTRLNTVRLGDGSAVALSVVEGATTVVPINTALPSLPRRRAVH